ncbi:MAG: ATP-binding protein [Desulfobacterales bacterium]
MNTDNNQSSAPSWEKTAEEAQRALKERPSISIRARLILGFGAWFALSIMLSVFSMVGVNEVQHKIRFLEVAQDYTVEIQQARRFEKNFFLYHTNLDEAIEHIRKADQILEKNSEGITGAVGRKNYARILEPMEQYKKLLEKINQDRLPNPSSDLDSMESVLRKHGAEMVTVAEEFLAKERELVHSMLTLSKRVPLIFLGLLLLLIIFLGYFIANQMLAPLKRMMMATTRIAEGDFTPITPRRRYNDEFSKLATALNHMMMQLIRRQEQLIHAHKLKAVGTLTAGVAHELNNPLNNIILTSSALKDDYKEISDEERDDMINDLLEEADRAQKIVRKLLDFAREGKLEAESLDMENLINRTLELASNQIKLAGVKVKGEIQPDIPSIYGDGQQLIQVFLNIILNATAAMPEGGELIIDIKNTKDREYVAVSFTDTGTGIPEHKLNQIFDPFYTTRSAGKGTGLGLSVSLGIIQKHGGDIKVSSQVNKGTTFTVLLPATKIPAEM